MTKIGVVSTTATTVDPGGNPQSPFRSAPRPPPGPPGPGRGGRTGPSGLPGAPRSGHAGSLLLASLGGARRIAARHRGPLLVPSFASGLNGLDREDLY